MEKTTESDNGSNEPVRTETGEPEVVYPDTSHLVLATIALMVAVFLVAIDVHILATASPKITTEFDSLLDLTWYGGAYLLAQIALQPTYARLYQVFPIKNIFVAAITTLEIGSIIGAKSSSSRMLIIGRALQGTGAGGVLAGGLLMINYLIPKPKRPLYLSVIASMYSVAAVVGPVLGGVFAESRLTWRFCFWINLPIGLIACAAIVFALKEPSRSSTAQPLIDKIKMLDPLGASVLIAWVTCLLLALQRASIPQPWSYSGIWGPLLAFGILFCIFVIVQYYQKDRAIIPYRIISQRTIAFCCLFEVTIFLGTTTIVYYLPFYFQSVKGLTPHQSGILILPFVVTNSFFAFAGGVVISKTGYYVPFLWAGSAIMVIGCGLLYTLNINSTTSAIVGFQMIASIGYGLCVQVPFTAVQVLPGKDIAVGNGLMAFFQGLGGALSVSAAQTIFSNALHQRLDKIPEISSDVIISYGATNFVSKVPSEVVHAVREAYGVATRDAFMLTIIGSGLAFLASLGVEWRRHYVPKRAVQDEEPGVTQREIVEPK
ncbi:MFS general substrate transporter [Amniculicola lignicola CBS 123094]|uniref:MFS general substrate transporter n=1 Tax=Amniculicola lignicola CBS 123094 TaxID=1392246 RepID=A0A6A5W2W4_9PLEO|nr:MFS general substrate transporter [Amniculicola lignicola CBS 123094]